MKNPEIIVFTGPMFGSKTTRLLAAIDRYTIQRKNVFVFKPRMDIRYDMSKITTHNGGSIDAYVVENGEDIIQKIRDVDLLDFPDIIAIDEAFMIDGVAEAVVSLYKKGITILISSLDLSASCTPFEEITKILPYATKIEKCPAVCTACGEDAYYTHKKLNNNKEIEVGGKDLYEPRCWKHYRNMNTSARG